MGERDEKFSSNQRIFSFFRKIFVNEMYQTWSKQLEHEDVWSLYREFPLFSPASHNIAEILLKLTFKHQSINQSPVNTFVSD